MFCVDNETMKTSDAFTVNSGISSVQLMQKVAQELWKNQLWSGKIYIICGKGNNGGDGLALANIMLDNGIIPQIFLTEKLVSDDSNYFLQQIIDKKSNIISVIDDCDYCADIIIDCIFGTGFSGNLNSKYVNIIQNINNSKANIISVDIPSGLNGNNGNCFFAVNANKTIAIQCPKIGCFLANGKDYCGKIEVIDIGVDIVGQKIEIVNDDNMSSYFLKRKNNSNKSSYGKSLIIGGCINYLGAVKLANLGQSALKSGGGLNVIAVPKSLAFGFLAKHILESTIFPLDEKDGAIVFNKTQIDECLKGVNCVAFGVGIGQNYAENLKLLKYILNNYSLNIVIDADGLNALAKDMSILNDTKCNVILTPHPKEMSRLCNLSIQDILENPLQISQDLVKKYRICLLLKGASTITCSNEGNLSLVINGSPALSKGGSGDTLSGVILGMLSQGISPYESCRLAAYLCAAGAKQAEIIHSEYGVLPSDVSLEIAKIVKNKLQ